MTLFFGILLVIFATLIGAYGAYQLKKGATILRLNTLYKNKELIRGILCYGGSVFLFIPALRYGDLHIIFPFTALTYVWSLIISAFVLHENVTRIRIIGVLLIMIGIILTALR